MRVGDILEEQVESSHEDEEDEDESSSGASTEHQQGRSQAFIYMADHGVERESCDCEERSGVDESSSVEHQHPDIQKLIYPL